MKHLDLFSGIGGFALATEMVWPDVEHIFCDNEPFSQAVLKKHWPNSKIYGDIRQLKGNTLGPIDLVTGGFPCQPFSASGRKGGKNDDRHLWPEMFRVIQETQPTWVIGENVAGIINMAEFEGVCTDLESESYEVQPIVIPACAVNAPHRRDRVWIIAHLTSNRKQSLSNITGQKNLDAFGENSITSDTQGVGHRGRSSEQRPVREGIVVSGEQGRSTARDQDEGCFERSWYETAAELCGMDDGLPTEMDEFKFTKAQHRNARIKGLGNAIVPQVAVEIMKLIKQTNG